ncbi:MAG: hypothetical protein ABI945_09475 [Nitrospirales bacterium]
MTMLTVRRETDIRTKEENYFVEFDPNTPPEVILDTHIWLNMSAPEKQALQHLKAMLGFRFRYSITNYVELLSQLAQGPTKKRKNPFGMMRGAFRKIRVLCDSDVLPSPEMAFLERAKLSHYLHPAWVPDVRQTAIAVDLIAKAETEDDITGMGIQTSASSGVPRWVLNPSHYLQLTQIDDQSMTNMMNDLDSYQPGSLTRENIDQLTPWLQKLAVFFLLYRPSNGRTKLSDLSPDERNRFWEGFTIGPGRMFHAHMTLIAIKTINWRKKIDPNDLYDAMQLLLLEEGRLFVTNEKNFLRHTKDSHVERLLPWETFKRLPS